MSVRVHLRDAERFGQLASREPPPSGDLEIVTASLDGADMVVLSIPAEVGGEHVLVKTILTVDELVEAVASVEVGR